MFYCLRDEIQAMLKNGGGTIVNMASILGTVGFANSPAYVAAKHGIVGLTKPPRWSMAGKVSVSTPSGQASSARPCSMPSMNRRRPIWPGCMPWDGWASRRKCPRWWPSFARMRLRSRPAATIWWTAAIRRNKHSSCKFLVCRQALQPHVRDDAHAPALQNEIVMPDVTV